MKKFLGVLFLVCLLQGCDDGDANVDSIAFDETDAKNCELLVYKISETQAMIIKLRDYSAFVNEPTLPGQPRKKEIGTNIDVVFRTYSGTTTNEAICASPPPIAPIATSEWVATEGTVEITTEAVYTPPNLETGQMKISQYRHSIIFRGIKFAKPDGTDQQYSEYVFGNFFTAPANQLLFNFDPLAVALCPDTNTLYNAQNGGREGLYIKNFDADLLSSDLGVKTKTIGQTSNRLVYRFFNATLPTGANQEYFCSPGTTLATPPGTAEEWAAIDGDGTNGVIEVTTTTFGSGVKHVIRLKGVTFKKGTSTFYYGNDMPYGELIVE